MLVARSFTYRSKKPSSPRQSSTSSTSTRTYEEKQKSNHPKPVRGEAKVRGFGWRPDSFKRSHYADEVGYLAAKDGGERRESVEARPRTAIRDDEDEAAKSTAQTPTELEKSVDATERSATPTGAMNNARSSHTSPVAVPSAKTQRPRDSQYALDYRDTDDTSRYENSRENSPAATVPRSMADLLAATQIPRRTKFSQQRPPVKPRSISIDELVEEWKLPLESARELSTSPAMSVLLSPPDDEFHGLARSDSYCGSSVKESEDDDAQSWISPSPSQSVDSVPSLDMDPFSVPSSSSMPLSPLTRTRSRSLARRRAVSLSKSMETSTTHPLLPAALLEDDEDEDDDDDGAADVVSAAHGKSKSASAQSKRPARPPLRPSRSQHSASHSSASGNSETPSRRSALSRTSSERSASPLQTNQSRTPARAASRWTTTTSSLTLSLRESLRSFSRSFSNFAVSASNATIPSDHLSRGLGLFPPGTGPAKYVSEMRPRTLDGPPSPQLRRYLNPQAYHFDPHVASATVSGPAGAWTHESGLLAQRRGSDAATAEMHEISALGDGHVELDAFPHGFLPDGTIRRTRAATSSDGVGVGMSGVVDQTGLVNEAALLFDPHQQRREPRENSEFLRIVVLQLAMRRAGKIEYPPFPLSSASNAPSASESAGAGAGASTGGGSVGEGVRDSDGLDAYAAAAAMAYAARHGTARRNWWLPPRAVPTRPTEMPGLVQRRGDDKVPGRWRGVCVQE